MHVASDPIFLLSVKKMVNHAHGWGGRGPCAISPLRGKKKNKKEIVKKNLHNADDHATCQEEKKKEKRKKA